MTQDPWGQQQAAGYVVRGEVVPDSESGTPGAAQAPPMTHFQKVASALRGDQSGQAATQPEQPVSQEEDEARTEDVVAVSSPDAGRDYWDDDEDEPEDGSAEDPAAGLAAATAASANAPAADPETAPSAPADQAEEEEAAEQAEEEEAGDQVAADSRVPTDHSMTQPNVFGMPQPSAGSIPTVPITLAEDPDGATSRNAAPEAPAAEAAQSAEAAPAAEAPAAEAELRPGESGTALALGESGYANLISDTADLRAQWHRIQYKFVDDPHASVSEAADVLAQVATRLEAAIAERQRGLRGRWDSTSAADTETLRETLRMYRTFLDQLIGPEPS
jgi:chemotaxis protein histidine kinase CheA